MQNARAMQPVDDTAAFEIQAQVTITIVGAAPWTREMVEVTAHHV